VNIVVGAPVDGELAAALPIGSEVGYRRDSYLKVGVNDWRRDVGGGYTSRHPINDNQMAGAVVRSIGAPPDEGGAG
jgi:hypothetical protein